MVVPGLPFLEKLWQLLGPDLAVHLPELPFGTTPDAFDLVGVFEMSETVVVQLMAVTVPGYVVVAGMTVGVEQAVSCNVLKQKAL